MDGIKWTLPLVFLLTACGQGNQGGSFLKNDIGNCSRSAIETQYIVNWRDGRQTVEHALNEKDFLEGFFARNRKDIYFAEPDYQLTHHDVVESPIEPDNTGSTPPNWGASAIHADVAWNQGFLGEGIVVAVVDSGVDLTRPQLKDQVLQNTAELNGVAGVDDDRNGFVDDINGYNFDLNTPHMSDESGHGTHVAGTILADPSKGEVLGIAPKAKLIPIDFMNDRSGSTSNAIRGMVYAINRGANVINASWGSGVCSQSLKDTFAFIDQTNVLVVVAAGNGGPDRVGDDLSRTPDFPAVFQGKNQITVGAMDPSGFRAPFSNYGTLVQLLAPGVKIYSTVPAFIGGRPSQWPTGYAFFDGTSMAAPHVAGMAAAIWCKRPGAPVSEVKAAIVDTVDLFNTQDQPRGRARLDKAINAF